MDSRFTQDLVLTPYARNLISYMARRLKPKRVFRRESQEDLEQDLLAYLLSRAQLYDPNRGSPNTFADRVLRSGIAMILRDRLRQKRAPEVENVSLERSKIKVDEYPSSLRDVLTESDLHRSRATVDEQLRQERIDSVRELLESLSPQDQELCFLRMSGSEASVAREMGMTTRQVRCALSRIRNRFAAGGFGET